MRDFTGVWIPAHIWTSKDLIPAEKMLLGEVSALSIKTGWCSAGRKHFAEWLHCELPNVTYYIKKLEKMGYLEVKREPGGNNKMRVVADRFFVEGVVNEFDGVGSKPDLLPVVNGTDGVVNGTDPKYNINTTVNKTLSPACDLDLSSLVNAEFGSVEVLVPPPAAAETSINLSDRPNAKTPLQLEEAMKAFFRSKDWRNEWNEGVMRIAGAWIPDGKDKTTQLLGILSEFCRHAVKNNHGGDTYAMLNASFQSWVSNEKHTTWKKSSKPVFVNTTAPRSLPPDMVNLNGL